MLLFIYFTRKNSSIILEGKSEEMRENIELMVGSAESLFYLCMKQNRFQEARQVIEVWS